VSGESCLTVTNTLVPYILSLIYAVPRVYRLSPTHSCHIYRFSCIRCLVTTVCHQHTRVVSCDSYVWCIVSTVHPKHTRVVLSVSGFKQFQSIPISCNWLRPIHLTHLILRHHQIQMERPRWHFCKHPHYLIRLISFELFVTITLPPLSRQGIEIIPYIKRFLEWIETLSLGGKLQSQKVLQVTGPLRYTCYVRLYLGASIFRGAGVFPRFLFALVGGTVSLVGGAVSLVGGTVSLVGGTVSLVGGTVASVGGTVASVGGTFTSVGGTIVGGVTRLNY
jgi:hypothetical protein